MVEMRPDWRIRWRKLVLLWGLCGVSLLSSEAQSKQELEQIDKLKDQLAHARATDDQGSEANLLLSLADLQTKSGNGEEGLQFGIAALEICRRVKTLRCEANALHEVGFINRVQGEDLKALSIFEETLLLRQADGDERGEARALAEIGRIYIDLLRRDEALSCLERALKTFQKVGDRQREAYTLLYFGLAYAQARDMTQAMEYVQRAMFLNQELKNRREEILCLENLAGIYARLNLEEKANATGVMALEICRDFVDRSCEANAYRISANSHAAFGKQEECLADIMRSLQIHRELRSRSREAGDLTALGSTYLGMGQYQAALRNFYNSLDIRREIGSRSGEEDSLIHIAIVYRSLGDYERSIEYYNRALSISRESGSRVRQAYAMHQMSVTYVASNQIDKALEFAEKALAIWRETGLRGREAAALSVLGWTYGKMSDYKGALEYFSRAIQTDMYMNNGDKSDLLRGMGRAYDSIGNRQMALESYMAALALAKSMKLPHSESRIDSALMSYWHKVKQPETAILFGTDAVNLSQQVRRDISGLDTDLQMSFVRSEASTYHELAELLIETDRLPEAEQVLDLLKEQELKEVTRGADGDRDTKLGSLGLSAGQVKANSALVGPERAASGLTALSAEYAELMDKKSRTATEEVRVRVLDKQIELGNAEISALFEKTVYPELAQANKLRANDLLEAEKFRVGGLQGTLQSLGAGVLGIRILVGEEHVYAIVVTGQAQRKIELAVKPSSLLDAVLAVRHDLLDSSSDPRTHLLELYGMMMAPLEGEFKDLEISSAKSGTAPTLLWSLDGALRYLPIGAMWDGTRYFVERFDSVLFTPESYRHMTTEGTKQRPQVLAMGLSKSFGGQPPLPEVLPELQAVVHDPRISASHGPLEGTMLPNEQFTLGAMKQQLGGGGRFEVVHIASHFTAAIHGNQEPSLMLAGDTVSDMNGYALPLSRLKNSSITFHGTRLLTLSACSTARSDRTQNGMEMDSLGMIAQQKDAQAVIATLWDVNDASTSRLMGDFYGRWAKYASEGKGEALRQAQIAMLHDSRSEHGNLSHPYYWAPFVLVGNYR